MERLQYFLAIYVYVMDAIVEEVSPRSTARALDRVGFDLDSIVD